MLLARSVDHAHAALTEPLLDEKATGDGRADERVRLSFGQGSTMVLIVPLERDQLGEL